MDFNRGGIVVKLWKEIFLVVCVLCLTDRKKIHKAISRSGLFVHPENWAYGFALKRQSAAEIREIRSVTTFNEAKELYPQIVKVGKPSLELLRKMISLAKTEEELNQIPSGSNLFWSKTIPKEIEVKRRTLLKGY
jgi:hypothetical protein